MSTPYNKDVKRKYYQKNRKKIIAYAKAYYYKNRKKILAQAKVRNAKVRRLIKSTLQAA